MTILDTLADHARARTERNKGRVSFDKMKKLALSMNADTGYPFEKALGAPGISFICEVKKASPSKGLIAAEFPYLSIAREYEAAGAAAISCLTEPDFFLGSDEYLCEPVAKVLASMGVKHALVVYGRDKMDEVSPSCETTVCELRDGFYRTIVIKPEDFGMVRGAKEEIVGGMPAENATLTRAILSGEVTGTRRNAVLLNAGCAIYAAGKASDIAEGVRIAAEKIDSGEALAVLDKFIRVSNEVA